MERIAPALSQTQIPIGDSSPMIAQPCQLYIERTDPPKNMARYHAMSIEPTLFGDVPDPTLGRVGATGQQIIHHFEKEEEAVVLFLKLLRQKGARGIGRPFGTRGKWATKVMLRYILDIVKQELAMSAKAIFTMKLEPELRDTFMAEAAADDRPAAQVLRELMREYINRRQQARQYDDYLRRKVEIARGQHDAGMHVSNEEVEAEATARRAELRRRTDQADL